MIGPKANATNHSVAVAGDNHGSIVNVSVERGGQLNLYSGVNGERALGTHLGKIIAVVAQQSLSEYGHAYQRDISTEVVDKLTFNYLSVDDRLIKSYRKYFYVLDRAYKGAEQSNNDARVLVRLRAGSIYETEWTKACSEAGVQSDRRIEYSRNNSHALVDAVKKQLMIDFLSVSNNDVDLTCVDLAVSLLVIDAVAECEVLERKSGVTST